MKMEVYMKVSLETEKILKKLIEIYNVSDGEIYINSSDERLESFANYETILRRLNKNGFFDKFSPDIIGNIRIVLSEKALSYFDKLDSTDSNDSKGKVFIVHGHDSLAKLDMARTIEHLGYEAIILHEQADGGNVIIEKLEKYSNVEFAVVLYTACDLGCDINDPDKLRQRARQNVVFEHGYLIGKLGRNKVCAFVKGEVETPGDMSGVVYTKMADDSVWKFKLAQNMKYAGLEVDLNNI